MLVSVKVVLSKVELLFVDLRKFEWFLVEVTLSETGFEVENLALGVPVSDFKFVLMSY
jgi:hypothetical protein